MEIVCALQQEWPPGDARDQYIMVQSVPAPPGGSEVDWTSDASLDLFKAIVKDGTGAPKVAEARLKVIYTIAAPQSEREGEAEGHCRRDFVSFSRCVVYLG